MRMMVEIPDGSVEGLNALAAEKGAPVAELVGNAVAEYVRVHGRKRTGEGIEKAFGLWGEDFEDVWPISSVSVRSGTTVERALRHQHTN